MTGKRTFSLAAALVLLTLMVDTTLADPEFAHPLADDPSPPIAPVKLIFVHHSTGGNWLADPNEINRPEAWALR